VTILWQSRPLPRRTSRESEPSEESAMRRGALSCAAVALMLWTIAWPPAPCAAAADQSTAALIDEVRRSFTLDGKPIPPEIFRDFGNGDLADSGSIWVTVDLKAAVGSNLYFDDITQNGAWIIQKKSTARPGGPEETSYTYIGVTENGLVVVLAAYNGGGSGDFIWLHILDVAAGHGFDPNGNRYDRINLTNLRSVALGDRWDGEIHIAKNTITVVTTRKGPADNNGGRETKTIEAKRP
jgi:hypothetical protein